MSTLTIELDKATEQNLSRISAEEGSAIEQVAAHILAHAPYLMKRFTPQEIHLLRLAREELSDALETLSQTLPTGRATVAHLLLNREGVVNLRGLLLLVGEHVQSTAE